MYTLKRFAHEAGINEKTLYNWCAYKLNVADKLEPELLIKARVKHLHWVASRVNRKTPKDKVNELMWESLGRNNQTQTVERYVHELSSLAYNMRKPHIVSNVKEEVLAHALWLCKDIIRNLEELGPKGLVAKQAPEWFKLSAHTRKFSVNKAAGNKKGYYKKLQNGETAEVVAETARKVG